jgi:5-methylcytosine-specific restriction endonuclease McrA
MPRAFLLTWNPAKFKDWDDAHLTKCAQRSSLGKSTAFRWSCANSTKPARGDRAFLMKLGTRGRGVFASGWITRGSYLAPSNDDFGPRKVDVDWDAFVDPRVPESLLDPTVLKGAQQWTPQNSGAEIASTVRPGLEALWAAHLTNARIDASPPGFSDRELRESFEFEATEGELVEKLVMHRRRERSLRNAKLVQYRAAHGHLGCEVCGFDFALVFGEEFAEVHHLKPLASTGPRRTNLEELAVLCANCHRMAHVDPQKPRSLKQLRAMRAPE